MTIKQLKKEIEELKRSIWDTMEEQSKKVKIIPEGKGVFRLENYDCVTEHDKQHITEFCAYWRILDIISSHTKNKMLVDKKDLLTEREFEQLMEYYHVFDSSAEKRIKEKLKSLTRRKA